ncbi:hypothetical protein IW261DRAFT_1420801 [Armillaria novae-zelandiae]|uniref:Uncharacterized protein n=1 Tax=Armillaria novae-zelandiae TaxID=153914 RepID=A0AA39UD75_9AGAR|nr:hypothetical protein IW261DRAFT_1420801 [Armillaria novae-zelandiae]
MPADVYSQHFSCFDHNDSLLASLLVYLAIVHYFRYQCMHAVQAKIHASTKEPSPSEAQSALQVALMYNIPFFTHLGAQVALLKTYRIPSISTLLLKTGEFSSQQKFTKRITDRVVACFDWCPFSPEEEEKDISRCMNIKDIPETIGDLQEWSRALCATKNFTHLDQGSSGTSSFILRNFKLPRYKPRRGYVVLENPPHSIDHDGRMHLHTVVRRHHPWYYPIPKGWHLILDQLFGFTKGDLYPGATFKCEGCRQEELVCFLSLLGNWTIAKELLQGPTRFEQSGHKEVMEEAEELYGAPIENLGPIDHHFSLPPKAITPLD